MRMIDFHILKQFVTFYHTGTLIEAAEILHISQSTLTRSMQKMESEFGVPLFVRTKNSIALTDAGKMAATDAEMILRQCENMLYRVQDYDRRNRTIMVGSCAPIPILNVVQTLTSIFPNATILSELNRNSDLLEGLQRNNYQLIILPYRPEDEALHSIPLCAEQIFFCLHKSHRFAHRKSLSTAEMNGENMLLFQDIGFWHDLVASKMPNSRFLVQSERYSFMELAANSTMPFFTTEAAGNTHIEIDRVRVSIKDPEFKVIYYLVCQNENQKKYRILFDQLRSNSR